MDVSVPPLEAAFIELFTKQSTVSVSCCLDDANFPFLDIWTLDELINSVGAIDKSSALKALMTWVDLGVLKEVSEDTFQLLELSEEVSATSEGVVPTRTGWISFPFSFLFIVMNLDHVVPTVVELPTAPSVQQQQAEQTRMYWKVCSRPSPIGYSLPVY